MCSVIVYYTVATRLSDLIQYLLVVQLLFDHESFFMFGSVLDKVVSSAYIMNEK